MAKEKLKVMHRAVDFDILADELAEELDMSPVNLSRGDLVENALSTGSLAVDLITGGGYIPGSIVIIQGETGSGKSTFSYFSVKSASKGDIPTFFKDHETSTDPGYLERIVGMPMEQIIGSKDKKGKYIIKPLMRYSQPTVGEDTFRFIRRMLKKMPDKVKKNDKWYYCYDKQKQKGIYTRATKEYDGIYKNKKNKFFIETENGNAQVLFYIDSLASMLPEARDKDDESSPMAKLARMFSETFPLVKQILGRKRATLVCTNQMRLKPMAFGDPRYPVGGESPKFYSDLVIDLRPVAPSTIKEKNKGKGGVQTEPCWDGKGEDRYKFSKVFIPKNKKFSPFRDTVIRLWFEHKGQSGSGIDPFYDCLMYLRHTGQIVEGRTYEISVPGLFSQRKWSHQEMKELCLNPDKIDIFYKYELEHDKIDMAAYVKLEEEVDKLTERLEFLEAKKKPDKKKIKVIKKKLTTASKELKKMAALFKKVLTKELDLIAACRAQIDDSSAFQLYFDTISGVNDSEEDEYEEEEEGDDEF